jgi:hypothetical protein
MQEERARGKSTLALENPRIRVAIRAGQSYIAPQAALAQLVRALDCGSRGPPFEPGRRYHLPSQNVNYDASARASAPDVSRIGKCSTVAIRPRTIAATHMA